MVENDKVVASEEATASEKKAQYVVDTPEGVADKDEATASTEPQQAEASTEPQQAEASTEPQQAEASTEPQQAEASTEPQQAEASTEPQQAEVSKPKQHKTAENRIKELVHQRIEAEGKLANALTELENLKNVQTKASVIEKPKLPTREDAEYDDDKYNASMQKYQEDLENYLDKKWDQKFKENQVKEQEVLQASLQAEKQTKELEVFQVRQEHFIIEHPDYPEVVFTPDLKMHTAVLNLIQQEAQGPEIAYYLGKNPEVAEKLMAMTPEQALVALGKVMVKDVKHKVSKAPAPISPIETSQGADRDVEKIPIGQFMQQRHNQYWQ